MTAFSPRLPILSYHRVGAFRRDHVPTISPETFARQLALLARFRYRVLSVEELVQGLEAGGALPKRAVVITFDDGYRETHEVAWPLLRKFGFPAAVFVTPDEVGRPGFATWEALGAMARDGMTIGSHTMNHTYLPLAGEERLDEEIRDSKRLLEERLARPVDHLSYPIGGFTPLVQLVVRQAGYRAAFTTNRAWSRRDVDRFALRRIKVTERDRHPLRFAAKVSGYYDLFRRFERPA